MHVHVTTWKVLVLGRFVPWRWRNFQVCNKPVRTIGLANEVGGQTTYWSLGGHNGPQPRLVRLAGAMSHDELANPRVLGGFALGVHCEGCRERSPVTTRR